jgi:hypothetical protein
MSYEDMFWAFGPWLIALGFVMAMLYNFIRDLWK